MLVTYFKTIVSTAGHVSCICVLLGTNLVIGAIDGTARAVVKAITAVTGARIEQDYRVPHAERVRTFQDNNDLIVHVPNTGPFDGGASGPNQIMDPVKTLEKTVAHARETNPEFFADQSKTFIGDETKLKELATKMIIAEFADPDLLADDFQFLFPVVGPLTRDQFVESFKNFNVRTAFPTSVANFYNFNVDPLEPNRIWMFSRGAYEHLGTLDFGPAKFPATNKRTNLPPQCFSMSFDENGKCYKLTGGYCVDRSAGDTEGLGGIFGIIHGLGLTKLAFPEGRPWKRSLMWEAFSLRIPQIMLDWKALSSSSEKPKLQ